MAPSPNPAPPQPGPEARLRVLSGESRWCVEQGDCLEWLATLPADSVDLALFSPPYEAARTYSIGFNLRGQDWVDWMVKVFHACLRVCKGLVACVCEGQTRGYRWSAVPVLLMADLHRAGVHLRRPCIYHRVGIPGSGGPDWLRGDTELIVCAARPGKLPWSDNTACGHPPKWAPGGEMSHRVSDGTRVNQWGKTGKETGVSCDSEGNPIRVKPRPSHRIVRAGGEQAVETNLFGEPEPPRPAVNPLCPKGGYTRNPDGTRKNGVQGRPKKKHTKAKADGDEDQLYHPPVLANPGNVIHCNVGGGQMGSPLAHDNEAPFPEALAEFFIRSFCPPEGLCIDPFSGSGTTGAVAVRWNRRFLGCDIRESQVELTRRRISGETPTMFAETAS